MPVPCPSLNQLQKAYIPQDVWSRILLLLALPVFLDEMQVGLMSLVASEGERQCGLTCEPKAAARLSCSTGARHTKDNSEETSPS